MRIRPDARPRTVRRPRGGVAARLVGLAAAVVLTAGAIATAPVSASASAQDLVLSGWHAYQAGALPRAKEAFLDAAQEAPAWATPAVWLGAVLVAEGDRTQAAEWFKCPSRGTLRWRRPATPPSGWRSWASPSSRPRWHVDTLEGLAGFVHATNASLSMDQARWVANALRTAGTEEGVEVNLLTSVLYIESRFNHQINLSSAGAMGLGQLMPGTAAPPASTHGIRGGTSSAPRDSARDYLTFHDWTLGPGRL